jgi:hypothetical protein
MVCEGESRAAGATGAATGLSPNNFLIACELRQEMDEDTGY